MKYNVTRFLSLTLFLSTIQSALLAQTITVNNGTPYNTPDYLVENVLVGGCLDISNITYSGNPNSIGYFSNGDAMGIAQGIVLSTGNINNIAAPASSFASTTWLSPGDPQLDALNPNPSNDAAVLQFDFKPLETTVSFNYVFASEEYPEWVGSAFNDVFAFFISGPGVGINQNMALLPGTSTPVGINFVNNGNANAGPCVNCSYYIANAGTSNVFDAYTTVLTATISGLTPCQTYHLKIGISDTQDWSFDSAVFLEANSFTAGEAIEISAEVPASTTGGADAYEGCQDGYFLFTRDPDGDLSNPLVLNINVSGSATSGSDYVPLPSTVTIPAGESSVQIPVTAFGDLTIEGYESIIVQVSNLLCNCTVPPPATLNIYDSAEIFQAFSSSDITICPGDEVLIAVIASGSPFTPYTYQWSNGATFPANFVAPTTTTTYTVTITDACGRTTTEPVTVNVSSQAPDATITAPASICADETDPIQLNAVTDGGIWSGVGVDINTGIFNPTLAISSGVNPVNISYSLNNNCGTDQDQVQIYINPPGDPIISVPPPLCAGSNGIITLSTDKPGGTWSGEGIVGGTNTTGQFDPALAQSTGAAPYTVTYTLSGNCGGTASATIPIVAAPTATISGNATLCGVGSASVAINISGGTAPYSIVYAIDNVNQAPINNINNTAYSLNVSQAATYTLVSVTDANGCTNSGTGTATILLASLNVTATPTPTVCNGSNTGSISLNITASGSTSFSYAWNNATIGNTDIANNLAVGTYTVTVTDNNGCSGTATATIDEPLAMTASIDAVNTCENGSNGSLSVSVQNGTAPYTYTWDNAALGNTDNPTGLAAATYQVTVSDQNACTATATATVSSLPISPPSIDAPATVCNGATATLSVSTNFDQYAWSSGQSTQSITATTAGTYSVTVTTADACSTSASHTLAASSIDFSLNASNIVCSGNNSGTISSNISGGTAPYTFVWTNNASTDSIATDLAVGDYSVTVTDNIGCSATATATISDGATLSLSHTLQDITCNGANNGSIDLVVTGGTAPYTFAWSGALPPTQNQTNNVGVGTYGVTVSDTNGCSASLNNMTIAEPTALDLSIIAQDATCSGAANGSLSLTVAGGAMPYAFAWSGGLPPVQNHSNSVAAGTYAVTVTDNNGCTISSEALVNEAAAIELNANTQNTLCNGAANGSIFLGVSGGTTPYTFAWSSGLAATQDHTNSVAAGTYAVTVTDANNCTAMLDNISVAEATTLQAIGQVQSPNCADSNNGGIFLTVEGGTAPYNFTWDNDLANNQDQTTLTAGIYNVTVSDANNCEVLLNFEVTAPEALSSTATVTPAACLSANNGAIDMSIVGGTAPYSYEWSEAIGNIEDPANLYSNTYFVTISDANGCTTNNQFTVDAGATINIEGSVAPPSCSNSLDGEIELTIDGGTAPYNYEWSGNLGNTPNPNTATTGNYSVTVTDSNSCSNTAVFEVLAPTALSLNYTANNATCNGIANGSIDLSVSGGASPYSYDWSGALPDVEDPNGVAALNYSVTVTDNNGCTATLDNINISQPEAIVIALSSSPASCGNADGEATAAVSGGTAPYTFAWTNASNTPSTGQVNAGTYSLTVTDSNGCTASNTTSVSNQDAPTIAVLNSSNTTCSGNNGSISIAVTNATTSYSVLWSNGSTTETLTNLPANTYSVTVTDANNCNALQTITLTDSPAPTLVADAQNATCGDNNGSIEINVSGNAAPFSFAWSHNSSLNSSVADSLSQGTYNCTVTDANNCTVALTTIIENSAAPQISPISQSDENCGNGNGSITIVVNNGVGSISYDWTGSSSTTNIADSLSAGIYSVTVTDESNCSDNATFTIINTAAPNLLSSNIIPPTCNQNNGQFTITASNGVEPYSYAIDNSPQDNGTFNNLAAGNYTVTVTDANACISTINVVLNNIAGVAISNINTSDAYCGNNNGEISLSLSNGTAPFNFTWTNDASSDSIATDLAAGDYSVTVTDANNCSATADATINQHEAPTAFIDNITNANCGESNGSVTINATGETTLNYTWQDDIADNVANADNLPAGNYSVTISDANNCTFVLPIIISNEGAPTVDAPIISHATCSQANGSISLTASGGVGDLTYTWTNNVSNSNSADSLAAGVYVITVSDENNCQTVVNATVNDAPAPNLSQTTTPPACDGSIGGSATISISGGTAPFNFTWTNDVSTNGTANNLAAGDYSVTVTDANNCSNNISLSIEAPNSPTLSLESTTPTTCGNNTGTANLNLSGGVAPYSFAWTNGVSSDSTATNLAAGDYSVTVTDANNCSDNISLTIEAPNSPTLSLESTTPTTCGNNTGTANLTISGGTAPFNFTWTNDVSTDSIATNLAAGDYGVTVTDANNCSDNISLSIEAPGSLTLSLESTTPTTCGNNTGTANLNISGGVAPYSFAWTNDVSTDSTATNLAAGDYSVTVTDANNCSDNISLTIEALGAPTLSLESTTPTACGNNTGTANLNVSGGTAPYSFTWTNDVSIDSIATNLAAGDYGVTVSDANNCSDNISLTIEALGAATLSVIANEAATCNQSNGSLSIGTSGGTAPYTYTWTNDVSTDSIAINLAAGDYSVTVTDSNACTQTLTMTVLNENAPTATATATDTACGDNGGTATVVATGGAGGYEFAWNTLPIQNTATASNLLPGNYSVTVTDANGCMAFAEATVNGNISDPILSCGTLTENSVTFNWTAVAGATGYQIALNGTPIDTLNSTTLSYTVTDLGVLETATLSVTALSDFCGNSATITQSCTTNGCPSVSLTLTAPTVNLCLDDAAIALAALPEGGTWSGIGISGNLFDPNIAGSGIHTATYTYIDIATACTYSETLVLTVNDLPELSLSIPENLCVGETAILQVNSTNSDNTYTWVVSGQGVLGNSPTQTLTWYNAGSPLAIVSAVNEAGCTASATGIINISSVSVSTIPDLAVLVGTPVVLSSHAVSGLGGTLSYEWQPNTADLSCSDCLSPTVIANENNTYTIVATDSYGCEATEAVNISVYYQNAVIIPNAFSPNGDGTNDYFQVAGQNIASGMLAINDRWGNEVYITDFSAENMFRKGWNGKYKDEQDAELGVYAYYVTVVFTDGTQEFLRGNVTLIR
jgi:gliding motility-associated-like protein